MNFEWDSNKNEINICKHGIDFRDIIRIFEHPMLTQLDTRRNYGEDRWIGIGVIKTIVAVVVYIEWTNEDTIRIISARKATRHERKEYYRRISY